MIYRVHIPGPPLSWFVENLWFYEGLCPDYRMDRLVPDGAIEFIVDLTDTPKHVYDESFRPVRTYRYSWISGQHTQPILIEAAQNSSMIGLRFRPGGAYPFFNFPISELNDSVTDLDAVLGQSIHQIRERLLDVSTPELKFSILEGFLQERCRNGFEPDRAVHFILDRLVTCPDHAMIRSLAEKTGLSQRQVLRRFNDRVGLQPKTMARILRFQKVLQRVQRAKSVSWSFIANECGYFDQAHFIRDFHSLSGMNPSQYLAGKGEYMNFIPIP